MMTKRDTPKEILDNMLGLLGYAVHIEEEEDGESGNTLQIYSEEAKQLIGRRGDRLDDIQYLLNRLLKEQDREAPRVRVDIEHYRTMREDSFIEKVKATAERVRYSGKPAKLSPMNSYMRRIVHHTFKDDPDIISVSSSGPSKIKGITLQPRASLQNDKENA